MPALKCIIMKRKLSLLLFVAAFAAACTNEMEGFTKDVSFYISDLRTINR